MVGVGAGRAEVARDSVAGVVTNGAGDALGLTDDGRGAGTRRASAARAGDVRDTHLSRRASLALLSDVGEQTETAVGAVGAISNRLEAAGAEVALCGTSDVRVLARGTEDARSVVIRVVTRLARLARSSGVDRLVTLTAGLALAETFDVSVLTSWAGLAGLTGGTREGSSETSSAVGAVDIRRETARAGRALCETVSRGVGTRRAERAVGAVSGDGSRETELARRSGAVGTRRASETAAGTGGVGVGSRRTVSARSAVLRAVLTSLAGRAVGASVDAAVTARAGEAVDGSVDAGVSSLRAVAAEGSSVREGSSRAERAVSGAVSAVGLRTRRAGRALALTDLVGVGVGWAGGTVAAVGRVSSFGTEGTAVSDGGVGLRTARAGVALDGSRAGGVGSDGTERAVQTVAGSSSRQTEVAAVVGESGLSSLGADGAPA